LSGCIIKVDKLIQFASMKRLSALVIQPDDALHEGRNM